MGIEDFLPKYPDIHKSEYKTLNTYKGSFEQNIFKKKEFYDNRLGKDEPFPKERGSLTKYQKTIVRFLSSKTLYDKLLLIHDPGLGKTCSAIGAIEQIRNETDNKFNGALIFAKGDKLLKNFKNELIYKCTAGQYIPENFSKLTEMERIRRINKKISYYQMSTFAVFAKLLSRYRDETITNLFSNKIIVIDEIHNIRIQSEKDEESVMIYKEFHRFLHIVKNCKILLMSGTPMKDTPEEIASVSNLLLPLDRQFPTGKAFIKEYLQKKGELYLIRDDKIQDIKDRLRGMVSFLRQTESLVKKDYIGKKDVGGLSHFIVDPLKMSKFQSKYFDEAYKEDVSGKKGVYTNSREASLFVFPDGSYGKKGFQKYVKKTEKDKKYRLSDELKNAIYSSDREEMFNNLKKYSCLYETLIRNIIQRKGCCFIYNSIVKGSGSILFCLILNLFGFNESNGKEDSKGLRYILLTTETTGTGDVGRLIKRFNKDDNIDGEYIKVIIGSKMVSEGFSFSNILYEGIATPYWNYPEIAQALARGIRATSHNLLLNRGDNVTVFIHQPVSISRNDLSIDLLMYKISEDKDISIRKILRILMEISFDCALNYARNRVEGKDGSRECDYTTCDFKCDGVDMNIVLNGVPDSELDYSTYQLYYSNPKTIEVRQKIEKLFRENRMLNYDNIIKNLGDKYTSEEIKNALFLLQEQTAEGDDFDYKDFLNIYSTSPVKKIINRLEQMFKIDFKISFKQIETDFKDYTKFELLTALNLMINNNLLLKDRYGLPSYLREKGDLYFLVNNISLKNDIYSEYYSRYPTISEKIDYDDVVRKLYLNSLPDIIKEIDNNIDNDKKFKNLLSSLPPQIQEFFIESSIDAKVEKKGNKKLRDRIIEYFKGYIKKVDSIWSSSYLGLRCKGEKSWGECPEDFEERLQKDIITRQEKLRKENPYGIIGKYNPENKSFCLVDYEREESLKKKKGKEIEDKRLSHSGKVCSAGGWKLDDLIKMAVDRLKIDPPEDFLRDVSKDNLLEKIEKDAKLRKLYGDVSAKKSKYLRRLIYWGIPKKDGGIRGIKPICEKLQDWLDENKYLEIDNQCGVQGKKQMRTTSKEKTKREIKLSLRALIPEKVKEEFLSYKKKILTIAKQNFEIKKSLDVDDKLWIIIFSNKMPIGYAVVKGDEILKLHIGSSYRTSKKLDVGEKAVSLIMKYADTHNINKELNLDARDKNYKKLKKIYDNLGFSEGIRTGEYVNIKYMK